MVEIPEIDRGYKYSRFFGDEIEPLPANVRNAIKKLSTHISNESDIDLREQLILLSILRLAGEKDWDGIPTEELKDLFAEPDAVDSEREMGQFIDNLNERFLKLEGERFAMIILRTQWEGFEEGRKVVVVSLDLELHNVTLWLTDTKGSKNDSSMYVPE